MGVLFALDGDYKARTEAETAELVPRAILPAAAITANTVLRGRIAGKVSKAEGPATMRLQVAIAARDWLPSHNYKLGEIVSNDTRKQYLCTTAGKSDTSGGPTGTGAGITDGEATWQYHGEAPVVFDTRDVRLAEAEWVNAFWEFDFELHMRVSRQTGVTTKQWHPSVLAIGRLVSPAVAGMIWYPDAGPDAALVRSSENNLLHVLYTPELGSGSITARCYVLEVL